MIDLLTLSRELHAIAQAGLTYSASDFELRRMLRLRELATQLLTELAVDDPDVVRRSVISDEGYLTPKLDVRVAVRGPAGNLLLVKEAVDSGWTLPGGWADVGESLAEGAVREVREEAGIDVVAAGLLGMYERERWGHPPLPWFTLKAVVVCDVCDPAARPTPDGHETIDARWFARDDVPTVGLSVGRTSPLLLRHVFERLSPGWDGRTELD